MPNTMTLIASTTLGGTAATIDFTSIPQTYTDLVLVHSLRCNFSTTDPWDSVAMNINGDATSGNYTVRNLFGYNGTSTGSNTDNAVRVGFSATPASTSNTFASGTVYIPNYTSSTTKSWSLDAVTENNGTANLLDVTAVKWSGTAAITSISIYGPNGGSFVQYSTASLYGILKGSGGATVS